MSVNSLCGSAPPMDAAPTTLGVANAMGASSDGDGLTPVMRAVLSGQLDQAVQLALSAPADLGSRDAQGRTAIELAVGANKREISLALLLIATAKFTRPLSPLLPVAILTRLQAWVLDRQGKNAKAAAVVAQQHVAWLTEGEAASAPSAGASAQHSLQSLVMIVLWGARHGHATLCEHGAHYFAQQAQKKGRHLRMLLEVVDAEGHTVLHALVLAGQALAGRDLVLALPRAEAFGLLCRRSHAGQAPAELVPAETMPHEVQAKVRAAAQEMARLAQQLAPPAEDPLGAMGAGGSSSLGRGGAVRRRKSDPVDPVANRMRVDDPAGHSSDDGKKAAAAAGDLLQLAALASGSSTGRARASQPRQRDAKPYQRRGGQRGRAEKDCWLPGGLWWKDSAMPMPSGRQPGELAGWQPLAGEGTQQRLQEQREALSQKEQLVQGLESRDDAAAYLQHLGNSPGPSGAEAITSSVDDSVIERSSTFKQLASWGGFRRHFMGEGEGEGGEDGQQHTGQPPAATRQPPGAAAVEMEGDAGAISRQRLAEQLLAKRAEILATQKKLESLSLEQQELEKLFTRTS